MARKRKICTVKTHKTIKNPNGLYNVMHPLERRPCVCIWQNRIWIRIRLWCFDCITNNHKRSVMFPRKGRTSQNLQQENSKVVVFRVSCGDSQASQCLYDDAASYFPNRHEFNQPKAFFKGLSYYKHCNVPFLEHFCSLFYFSWHVSILFGSVSFGERVHWSY